MDTDNDYSKFEITPEDSVSPVYLIPLTEDQLQEISMQEAERLEKENKQKENEINLNNLKESAIAKLQKLGLTEEEAKAIIGL